MPSRISVLSVLALGAFALAGCSSGTPEAAVKDTTARKILTGDTFLTGLGLQKAGSVQRPDTSPRAPLVIPPERNLPQPEDGSEYSASNAAWPNDPDEAAARRRNELLRKEREAGPYDPDRDQRLLQTRRSLAEGDMAINERPDKPLHGPRVSADQYERDRKAADREYRRSSAVARAVKEERQKQIAEQPHRRTLMDPPVDYTQAPEGAPPSPVKKKKRFWIF